MNKLHKSTLAITFFWVAMIFLYIVGFIFLSGRVEAQNFDNYKKIVVNRV